MADANVALATGPAAQFINPATLESDPSGVGWEIGVFLASVQADFRRETPVAAAAGGLHDAEPALSLVPSFAAVWSLRPGASLGLSLEAAHGLGAEWRNGSFALTGDVDIATRSDLQVLRFGPALAWNTSENWRAGIRIFVQYVEALEASDLATIEGDGHSFGFQLGLRHQTAKTVFGAAYTSRTRTRIEGEQRDVHPLAAGALVPGPGRADIYLPDRLQLGFGLRLRDDLWWEFDLDRLGWSYVDELVITQANDTVANAGKTARHNRDTVSLRTALKWQTDSRTVFYAGLGHDPSPVAEQDASPLVSLLRKTRVGVAMEKMLQEKTRFGLAYQFVRGHSRRINESGQDNGAGEGLYEGTYSSRSHVLAVSLRRGF